MWQPGIVECTTIKAHAFGLSVHVFGRLWDGDGIATYYTKSKPCRNYPLWKICQRSSPSMAVGVTFNSTPKRLCCPHIPTIKAMAVDLLLSQTFPDTTLLHIIWLVSIPFLAAIHGICWLDYAEDQYLWHFLCVFLLKQKLCHSEIRISCFFKELTLTYDEGHKGNKVLQ